MNQDCQILHNSTSRVKTRWAFEFARIYQHLVRVGGERIEKWSPSLLSTSYHGPCQVLQTGFTQISSRFSEKVRQIVGLSCKQVFITAHSFFKTLIIILYKKQHNFNIKIYYQSMLQFYCFPSSSSYFIHAFFLTISLSLSLCLLPPSSVPSTWHQTNIIN